MCGHVQAKPSIWVYNQTQDTIVFNQNANTVRPVASITKLMTAMVALDHDPKLTRSIKLVNRVGSSLPGGQYTRRQLFDAMLVRSDNAAAETLARDYPGGRAAFVRAMNRRARGLGMTSTRFQDPSGLNQNNTGTAGDIGTLVTAAGRYAVIREISVQQQVRIESHFKQRVRIIALPNTNQPVLFSFDNIQVSKTGFTNPAGWCVALLVERNKQTFAVVVLGSENKSQRLDTVKNLMYNHVNDAAELPVVDDPQPQTGNKMVENKLSIWEQQEIVRLLKGAPGTQYQAADDVSKMVMRDWIKNLLQVSTITVQFTKADGTVRDMQCTLNPEQLPDMVTTGPVDGIVVESTRPRKAPDPHSLRVFDVDKQEWRSFRFDRLLKITAELKFA